MMKFTDWILGDLDDSRYANGNERISKKVRLDAKRFDRMCIGVTVLLILNIYHGHQWPSGLPVVSKSKLQ